jgi:hypothetical protein
MFKSERKQKAEKLADRLYRMAKVSDVRASNSLISDKERAAHKATSETLTFCAQLIEKEIVSTTSRLKP